MTAKRNSMKTTWLLVIALASMLLVTFTACSDDIIGPRVQDEEPEDEENHDEAGGLTRVNPKCILQGPARGREICPSRQLV